VQAFEMEQVRFTDGTIWDATYIQNNIRNVTGTDQAETLVGSPLNNMVSGLEGDDYLQGLGGDDLLQGGSGNDSLQGGEGNDILDGGSGNDGFEGGEGSDTYLYGRGDGQDVISDFNFSGTDQNIIQMSADILPSDVFARSGIGFDNEGNRRYDSDDLVLGINGTTDYVAIEGFYRFFSTSEQVQFADGTVWDRTMLEEKGRFIVGTDDSDILLGHDSDDQIFGLDGNDHLDGRIGSDILSGGAGDDLYRLIFDATDTIVEAADAGTDTVESSFSYTLPSNIENLTLSVGDEAAIGLNGIGNELDNVLIGNRNDNVLDGLGGDDTLSGGMQVAGGGSGEGEDEGEGGGNGNVSDGNDLLIGGTGNDTYLFGRGSGIDTIQDTAALGEGNRIFFEAGITADDLTFIRSEDTLTITLMPRAGSGGGGEEGGVEGNSEGEGEDEGGGSPVTSQDAIILQNFDPNRVNGSLVVERLEFADGSFVNMADLFPPTGPVVTDGDDTLTFGSGDDVIDALGGNDTVDADGGNDTVYGGAGNDTLLGGEGNDALTGGTGNDLLTGGTGDDAYAFNLGDGVDTITDTAAAGEGNELVFGPGITPNDLSLGLGSLLIRVGTNGDAIHLNPFDPADAYGPHAIDTFRFADGTRLSYSQLIDRGFDLTGTAGDDTIAGTNAVDRMNGLTGDDTLQSADGDDVLDGGTGNDTLSAGSGQDQLTGGIGNDALDGGAGDDTYHYSLGDGLDQVTDTAGADTVQFGAGISFDNTVVRLNGSAAQLRLLDADGNELADQGLDITLGADGTAPIETLTFADGSSYALSDLEIQTVETQGTKHDDLIRTGRHDDVIKAGKGDDIVYSGTGHDTAHGGKGDDRLFGEGGDDSLLGGKGDDWLDGGAGDDVLKGGKGDDTLAGGMGNDTLRGGKGRDTLQGGAGNDLLDSGEGHDTILFCRGDGQDTLIGRDHNRHDTVQFGSDLNPLDLILSRQADDLHVAIYGTSDQFTVEGWYADRENRVDEFVAGNGQSLEDSKVNQLIQAMAGFGAQTGLSWEQAIAQRPQDVQQILAASWK
jgi:Ca2+-binding RTX toxin-like protein